MHGIAAALLRAGWLATFFFCWLIFSMYLLKKCFWMSFMSISRPWI